MSADLGLTFFFFLLFFVCVFRQLSAQACATVAVYTAQYFMGREQLARMRDRVNIAVKIKR